MKPSIKVSLFKFKAPVLAHFFTPLFILLLTLFLLACSESDDNTPPQLKSHPEAVSIYDTLKIEFNEKITQFDSNSYRSDPKLDCWSEGSQVLCVGVEQYPESLNENAIGMPVLLEDTTYILALKEIIDTQKNEMQGQVEVEFYTHLNVDTDFNDGEGTSNDQLFNADSIGSNKKWLNGDASSEWFEFSGILEDKNQSGLAEDQRDVYFTYLNAKDSISIKLHSNIEDVTVSFVGPIEFETTQVFRQEDVLRVEAGSTQEEVLTVYINGDRHILGIDSDESTQLGTLKYWIEVEYPTLPDDIENIPTPYTIEVQVH